MIDYKIIYVNKAGNAVATVCSYSHDAAQDRADELEDEGFEVVDIVQVSPGQEVSV